MQSSLAADALSNLENRILQDQHYYDGFQDELRMLLRVQTLYRRHPEIEVIAADMFQARLFEQAEPSFNTVPLSKLADSDFEILDYLRDNAFTLLPRLEFVRQRVADLRERVRPVACPICKSGKLRFDASTWIRMKREPQVGDVLKYSRPAAGEADFRFLLKEHNGDRVVIELICTERIRPVEVVSTDEIEIA